MQCNAFKDERRAMESEFATVTSETDSFGFALKTNPQKFAFLMSAGVSPQNPNFKTWRAMELYRYLYAADNKRKRFWLIGYLIAGGAYPFRMDFGPLD